MSAIDIVILALIAVAFVAACVHIGRKGSCGDCSAGGTCSGSCSASCKKSCPAMKGVDAVADQLGRNVR